MISYYLKVLSFLTLLTFIVSGCSTAQLKEKNAELELKVAELEQTRQDYADQIRNLENMSAIDKAEMRSEMSSMREELDNTLHENQVLINKLEDLTVIEIDHAALFASGDADLSAEGKEIVKKIAQAFNNYSGYHMRIEGHTDNVPLNDETKRRFFSNWELSSARAGSVVRYMIYGLNIPPENLSIAGYASYRPIADNDTPKGRAKNRRIRAVVFKQLD